jgi:hypothetical protein
MVGEPGARSASAARRAIRDGKFLAHQDSVRYPTLRVRVPAQWCKRKAFGLSRFVVFDLIERHTAVGCILTRESQDAFADNVAGHLIAAPAEGNSLAR